MYYTPNSRKNKLTFLRDYLLKIDLKKAIILVSFLDSFLDNEMLFIELSLFLEIEAGLLAVRPLGLLIV